MSASEKEWEDLREEFIDWLDDNIEGLGNSQVELLRKRLDQLHKDITE